MLKKGFPEQGVLFWRTNEGLPDCGRAQKTRNDGYLPYGVWTDDGQAMIDAATSAGTCLFPERRSNIVYPLTDGVAQKDCGDDKGCGVPVCYSTEALKFAQSSYFVSMPMVQLANLWFCKTRKLSILHQGMGNTFMNWSVLSEIGIALLLMYVPFCNTIFNTRPLEWWHFMLPAVPFAVYEFLFDEGRKYFVRQGDTPEGRRITKARPSAFGRWAYGHSYY